MREGFVSPVQQIFTVTERDKTMSEQNKHIGPESLDKSIEKLETQLQTLQELQDVFFRLDDSDDVDLHVVNKPDSHQMDVTVVADEPVEEMEIIASAHRGLQGEATKSDDIIYDHEDDVYRLTTKFQTDR